MKDRMKNVFMLSVVLIMGIGNLGYGQTIQDDPQWYVKGGRFWNSNNTTQGNVEMNFKITGVAGNASRIQSRNDLFVIYQDGTCYTNRLHPRINNGLSERTNSSTFTDSSLQINSPKNIRYLYWTNVYDDDDPRNQVGFVSGGSGNNGETLGVLNVTSMFAHQDIVPNSDVVLVLPPSNTLRKLKFNLVNDTNVNVLSPQAFFNNGNICLNSSCRRNNNNNNNNLNEIIIKADTLPVYIVFKSNEPNLPNLFGSFHTWELYNIDGDQETLIDTYKEKILTSHDPNYIQLLGLCEENNSKFALYRAHFENDGDVPEDKISFSFESPWTGYMSRSGKVCSKGGVLGGSKNKENLQQLRSTFYKPQRSIGFGTFFKRRVRHQFISTDYFVDPLKYGNPLKATGYFEFCVQIKDEIGTSLDYKLINPTIYFNGSPLAIKKFVPDSKVVPRINNCNCCE